MDFADSIIVVLQLGQLSWKWRNGDGLAPFRDPNEDNSLFLGGSGSSEVTEFQVLTSPCLGDCHLAGDPSFSI